jgi:chloramphenicol-sensitive protein RarD
MNRGIVLAGGSYVIWGLLAIYWKALAHVPALETLAHRMAWSVVVVLGLLAVRGQWGWLVTVRNRKRIILPFAVTAFLVSLNWYVYIWAVGEGYLIETSLGYFINPLVNVLLGVIFLRERLRLWQGVAIALAAASVLFLTVTYGSVPWIALTLAFSFGLYGLIRKTVPLESLEGLTLETLFLVIPGLTYLLYLESQGRGTFGHTDGFTTILLVLTGVVTTVPLLLFAAGARRVSMTSLGLLQYMAPTITFFLGVFVYHEPLSTTRFIGFCIIWAALLLYVMENRVHSYQQVRDHRRTGAPEATP